MSFGGALLFATHPVHVESVTAVVSELGWVVVVVVVVRLLLPISTKEHVSVAHVCLC